MWQDCYDWAEEFTLGLKEQKPQVDKMISCHADTKSTKKWKNSRDEANLDGNFKR